MKSQYSESSRVSEFSQKLLKNVAELGTQKLFKLQGELSENLVEEAWASFGIINLSSFK